MAKQRKSQHLAGDLSYEHEESTSGSPGRYLHIFGATGDLHLSPEQGLALLQVLLDDIVRLVAPFEQDDALLEDELLELHLVHTIRTAIERLINLTEQELLRPDTLAEARKLQQAAFDSMLEMTDVVNNWEAVLEREHSKLEDAEDEIRSILSEEEAGALFGAEEDDEDEEDELDELDDDAEEYPEFS